MELIFGVVTGCGVSKRTSGVVANFSPHTLHLQLFIKEFFSNALHIVNNNDQWCLNCLRPLHNSIVILAMLKVLVRSIICQHDIFFLNPNI